LHGGELGDARDLERLDPVFLGELHADAVGEETHGELAGREVGRVAEHGLSLRAGDAADDTIQELHVLGWRLLELHAEASRRRADAGYIRGADHAAGGALVAKVHQAPYYGRPRGASRDLT
jgi:hypothetical protein